MHKPCRWPDCGCAMPCLDELDRLARAATPGHLSIEWAQGEWKLRSDDRTVAINGYIGSFVIGTARVEAIARFLPVACNALPELIAEVRRLREALAEVANRQVNCTLPWTHEAAADEYSRMLQADQRCARLALGEKP